MSDTAASLLAALDANTPAAASGYVVGLSGGGDSSALLTWLVQAHGGARRLNISAVHIDHGLQAAAPLFVEACKNLCEQLGVPLRTVRIDVQAVPGQSVEAAARTARYAAFAALLRPGECLLTGHHRRDQAETLLLQALRGAGLRGMSAMPVCRVLGAGFHVRPALNVAQHDLLQASAVRAAAVTDPMNEDLRFDRSYLRKSVWPAIEQRWPGAATALARAARHVGESQQLLDLSATADLTRLRDGDSLSLTGLRGLSAARRISVVRLWLHEAAVAAPSTARLTESLRQMFDAAEDQLPAVEWGDRALRRYRQRLFLTAANPPRLEQARRWFVSKGARIDLGPGLGQLCWATQLGGIDASRLPATLLVRPRQGGETLRPAPRAKTQSVQHLYQSHGVLPWMRDSLPMVAAEDELLSVADLWLDARWWRSRGCAGLCAHLGRRAHYRVIDCRRRRDLLT